MKNLIDHAMNSNGSSAGGYEGSEIYRFLHNTVLPNLKKSGLNITSCDLVSQSVYNDICSKTGIASTTIADGENFWLTDLDPDASYFFCFVDYNGRINSYYADHDYGVRPLITVVM